ncbi:MAG: glycoside hydrolase family 13 protein [Spirochaetaceae bacterium]|nr:glycoside hydrolase family 13 protein [Spirochaetaceae bacterium]
MQQAALFHRVMSPYAYPIGNSTLVLRLLSARDDLMSVHLVIGDPYEWRPGIDGKHQWHAEVIQAHLELSDGVRDCWRAAWHAPWRRARYFFLIKDSQGEQWVLGERRLCRVDPEAGVQQLVLQHYWDAFVMPYIHENTVFRAPAWVPQTVWYQIFPERFRNGNPQNDPPGVLPWRRGPVKNSEWYGGDLAGVLAGLDHIQELGCNGIYLTPVFSSPSVHKYDTREYFIIDPAFGTEEDLLHLVEECHRRGMRIMLDAVFNHAGREFEPWKDVVAKGDASPFARWFRIEGFPLFGEQGDTGDRRHARFETFAFTTRMPKFDTTNPEVREFLISGAEEFTRKYGIDGWRLDVANEIDHEFWREFRRRMKSINPELYIVGEVWHDALPWLQGDKFDAVMNYPLQAAIGRFIGAGNREHAASASSGCAFARELAALAMSVPEMVPRWSFNLLDSHDTDRITTRFGSLQHARLALFVLCAMAGSPCIYYGTEYGLEGDHDPDNRRCMIWDPTDEENAQAVFVRRLIAFRKRFWRVFAEGTSHMVWNEHLPGFWGIVWELGSLHLAMLANRSNEAVGAAVWRAALGCEGKVELVLDTAPGSDAGPDHPLAEKIPPFSGLAVTWQI